MGSVRSVVDESTGVLQMGHYAPYGKSWGEQGTAQTSFGFTGEPTDQNGLVHLRARYYSPVLGVFPSLDPLEGNIPENRSLNRYGYVQGNPINLIDSSGMIGETPTLGCPPKPSQVTDCTSEINDISNTWGISLTYNPADTPSEAFSWCSYLNTYKALADQGLQYVNFIPYLRAALAAINSRGISVRSAFSGLNFQLNNSKGGQDNSAFTPGSDQVLWYAESMALELALFFQNEPGYEDNLEKTFVHELGHVLENRTHNSPDGMFETATYNSLTLLLPSRTSKNVTDMTPKGRTYGNRDETKETIADYFMFWVYDRFNKNTVEGKVAQIYMEGGLVVVDRSGAGSYPLALFENEVSFVDRIWAAYLAANNPEYVHRIDSLGITRWTR